MGIADLVGGTPAIGRVVGWRAHFEPQGADAIDIDHRSCWADVTITLDSGLAPGRVEMRVRGVTPDQFRTLAMARLPRSAAAGERAPSRQPLYGTVALFWRDQVGSDPSATDAPNIASFAVTELSRRNEGLETITTIVARSRIYDRLARALTQAADPPTRAAGPIEAARQVLLSSGFADGTDFQVSPPTGDGAAGNDPDMIVQPGRQALGELAALEEPMLLRYGRRGRGAYLIRDAKLLVGPFRPIPAEGDVKLLDDHSGFISAERQGEAGGVAGAEAADTADPLPPPRDVWHVRTVGRPDLKPGDVVRFTVPGEDAALFSGFGLLPLPGAPIPDQQVTLYVTGVSHTSGRNLGWDTRLSGVSIAGEPIAEHAWDSVRATTSAVPASGETHPHVDTAASVRGQIARLVAAELSAHPASAIGEVRQAHAATTMAAGQVTAAAQSSDMIVGIANDAGAGGARLSDLARSEASARAINVPYLTSFAWGPYGMVLPRYPGTRVMVAYHRTQRGDPVDIGALWRTNDDGQTVAPASQPGDWWMILPAGLASAASGAQSGTAPISIPQDAKATHDLIDADGHRLLAVNGFTIRSYSASGLPAPTARPAAPSAVQEGGIWIEHVASGATISIDTDGKITIKATDALSLQGTSINIKSSGEVQLEGTSIKLKPGSGTVDVG